MAAALGRPIPPIRGLCEADLEGLVDRSKVADGIEAGMEEPGAFSLFDAKRILVPILTGDAVV